MTCRIKALVTLALLFAEAGAGQSWNPDAVRAFLGFTEGEWKEVDRGGVVAKTLPATEGQEVAVLGAVRADASTACFLTQFEDIERFKKSPAVLAIHKFAQPPGFPDLHDLLLDDKDQAALRGCRPGGCDVKLPASAIDSLQGADSPDAFRQWLWGYIQAYLTSGNAALIQYNDKPQPVRLEDEFHALLDAKPSLGDFAPDFYAALAHYAGSSGEDSRDFLYWSKEDFGFKPVISVTHVNIHQEPGQAIIASKQIYATHYFDGSLGLTFLLDAPLGARDSVYIMYLNRSRIDLLRGWLGGLRRFFLRGRLLDGFKKNLRDVARRLESSCGTAPNASP